MERVAVSFDDELAGSLSRYARRRGINRDIAAERLLAAALAEWRLDDAIERFGSGEFDFDRAADAAEIDVWRFAELLEARALDPENVGNPAAIGERRATATASRTR